MVVQCICVCFYHFGFLHMLFILLGCFLQLAHMLAFKLHANRIPNRVKTGIEFLLDFVSDFEFIFLNLGAKLQYVLLILDER